MTNGYKEFDEVTVTVTKQEFMITDIFLNDKTMDLGLPGEVLMTHLARTGKNQGLLPMYLTFIHILG